MNGLCFSLKKKNTRLVGELHSEMQINHVSKDSDFRKLVKFEVMLLPENWIRVCLTIKGVIKLPYLFESVTF